MVGHGISLFVAREVGFLPPRVSFSGLVLDQMIVVLAVPTAPADQGPATFHLIPAEYLADPVYPGLPLVLSPSEIQRWLAPPPVFQVTLGTKGGVPGWLSGPLFTQTLPRLLSSR